MRPRLRRIRRVRISDIDQTKLIVQFQNIIVFLIVLGAVVYIGANVLRKHLPRKSVGGCNDECGCGR